MTKLRVPGPWCYPFLTLPISLIIALRKSNKHGSSCLYIHTSSVSYNGEFSPTFDLINMISLLSIFQGKYDPNLSDFKFKISKSPESYHNFQKVVKNREGFCFFLVFISIILPNLAKLVFR